MPSFETESGIFVHVPKSAGMSVYWTARRLGLVLREAPPDDGHQPASWFGVDKPAWCVIRHPLEWYPSRWRYHMDTGWRWEPDHRGKSFAEWLRPGLYSEVLAALRVAEVADRWRYEAAAAAFVHHVGPHELLRENVSVTPRPELTAQQRAAIERADGLAYELYESSRPD